jgi:branched-chain amino acid transport system permease protein
MGGASEGPATSRIISAVTDAAIAALVALVLFAPLMGLRTQQHSGGIVLQPNWTSVAWAVGIVFVGRLFLRLTVWRTRPVPRAGLAQRLGALAGPGLLRWLAGAAILFAAVMPFIPGIGRVQLDLGILVLTYVMLGWGLNIVVGLAGLLDLGYVAFYAVGAYSYALLAQNFGLSFWICLPVAGILAALWGLMLGFPVLRLRGDYLAIVTLAFGEIIHIVLQNWDNLTGGPRGVRVPSPTFFGIPFSRGEGGFAATFGLTYSPQQRYTFLYYLILALALITNLVTLRLRRLPVGRAWEALREDEIACRALGINTVNTKLTAFALGALFGGFAGAFFAVRQGFIEPNSFVFMESAMILSIVVLGGMGSQFGVALAAVLMIGGFEYLRMVAASYLPGFEQYRMLIFGAAMVLIMVWRPRGIIAGRSASVFLRRKTKLPADLRAEEAA